MGAPGSPPGALFEACCAKAARQCSCIRRCQDEAQVQHRQPRERGTKGASGQTACGVPVGAAACMDVLVGASVVGARANTCAGKKLQGPCVLYVHACGKWVLPIVAQILGSYYTLACRVFCLFKTLSLLRNRHCPVPDSHYDAHCHVPCFLRVRAGQGAGAAGAGRGRQPEHSQRSTGAPAA